jgi:ribosomal protein L24E
MNETYTPKFINIEDARPEIGTLVNTGSRIVRIMGYHRDGSGTEYVGYANANSTVGGQWYVTVLNRMTLDLEPRLCGYCSKWIAPGQGVDAKIYSLNGTSRGRFCDSQCATYAQFSAEG